MALQLTLRRGRAGQRSLAARASVRLFASPSDSLASQFPHVVVHPTAKVRFCALCAVALGLHANKQVAIAANADRSELLFCE